MYSKDSFKEISSNDENIVMPENARKKIEKIITRTKVGCLPDTGKIQKLIECLPIEEKIIFEKVVYKKNEKIFRVINNLIPCFLINSKNGFVI